MPDFESILVANRGEIVLRVARTARSMGIEVVAVYSSDDSDAPHVRAADRAVRLEGGSLATTYLDAQGLVQAAVRAGVDAIHPGYGLLSEDHRFATACVAAGLGFIGPAPEVIRKLGLKDSAKQLARSAGVPVLDEVVLVGDDPRHWQAAAESVGYPVIVKAVAGGGGRAMHVVRRPGDLVPAIHTARREAARLFGVPDVFVERYLPSPRHVEVQVLGDEYGNAVHLFERECSIQRRHQKIVEEAPCAAISADLRDQLCEASVRLVRALGYVGVGTLEYLIGDAGPDGRYFFLEMNPRIQVEHPVTEEILRVDLVRLQLEVAMGHPIPFTQESLVVRGHSIEARLYAERPAEGFAPSTGRVLRYEHPALAGVRYEDGVECGTTLSPSYEPMLGKVVAHGGSRRESIARLVNALRRMRIHGIACNRELLIAILKDPDFAAGETRTDFVETHPQLLMGRDDPALDSHLAAIVAVTSLRETGNSPVPLSRPGIQPLPRVWSPTTTMERVDADSQPKTFSYRLEGDLSAPTLLIDTGNGAETFVVGTVTRTSARIERAGISLSFEVREYDDGTIWVNDHRTQSAWRLRDTERGERDQAASGDLVAAIAGTVVRAVPAGQRVEAGEPVAVLEAMKIEIPLASPFAGYIAEARSVGDFVDVGEVVARCVPASPTPHET